MSTLEANAVDTDLKDDFKIRFDGDQNQIDANTFVNYLVHFNTIVQELNRELAPERRIKVKITALEKGSFIVGVELQSVIDQIKLILDPKTVEYLGDILTVLTGLVALKAALKGNKPEQVKQDKDSVTITGADGQVVTVNNFTYNVYITNPTISQALTKQFEALEQDDNIEAVQLTDKENRTILEVPRELFNDLAQPNEIFEGGIQHELRPKVMLSIVKLSFDPKLKSDFVYMGIRISAYIKDKTFYQQVDKGRAFSKGDALEVKMQVNKVFDTSVNTEVIKSYDVLEVLRHVPRNDPGQLKMDLKT